ncbi:hypothetical protein [Burkholderia cenocepacia]|uniref:hypothetical protein n=1 Tax=Burkholderia cenocepacia TaxID=95486 RepID=UPI002ABE9028|nr:hypothetical protein [Burkholderia cenocepacia]
MHALGGTELFVAVERLTDHALPVDLASSIDVAPCNASSGLFLRAAAQRQQGIVVSAVPYVFD